MPPSEGSDERRRLSIGGETRIFDVSGPTKAAAKFADEPIDTAATPPGSPTARSPVGATSVLVRDAVPAGTGRRTADDGVTYVASRRSERQTMVLSTVVGTLGLMLAVAAAGLDQVRYDQPGPCAAYAGAHAGRSAFGCSTTAKHIAVFAPVIGIPLLVLVGLVVVWVPEWLPKARFGLLGGLFLALAACATGVAVAYSALPGQS